MCVKQQDSKKIYLDTIMRPQEGCTFNQVNIWHITPARPPACLCLALPSRKPRCLCRCEGSSLSPRSNLNEANSHQSSETEFGFSTIIKILTCHFFFMNEIHSIPHKPVCLHVFVRTSDKYKRYQLWGNLPNGAYCRSVCIHVYVCVCLWGPPEVSNISRHAKLNILQIREVEGA